MARTSRHHKTTAAKRGEISAARPKKLRAVIEGTLDRDAGSTQVHLIGDERKRRGCRCQRHPAAVAMNIAPAIYGHAHL